MPTRVIRYRTKPEAAATNRQLIADVFAGLAERSPTGIRYASFVLDDGLSFVHVVQVDEEADDVLGGLPAFVRFQQGIAERCDEQPVAAVADVVGSYRLFDEP